MAKTTISAKEAVRVAVKYFTEVVGTSAHLTVEEVELDGANGIWLVTLGIDKNPYGVMMPGQDAKEYKEFAIDVETSNVLKMKIKKL